MGKPAHAIAHYEEALKVKDAQIAACNATNASLQAQLSHVSASALDAEDREALAQAEARFPELATPAPVQDVAAPEAAAETPAN